MRVYLSKDTPSECDLATGTTTFLGELADRWAAALSISGKTVMRSLQMKGQNIHWRGLWGHPLRFSPQLHFLQGRRDFCPYWTEGRSASQGNSACWGLLTCKANFILMTAEGTKGYFRTQEIPALRISFCLLLGPLTPQMCGFLSAEGAHFPLFV